MFTKTRTPQWFLVLSFVMVATFAAPVTAMQWAIVISPKGAASVDWAVTRDPAKTQLVKSGYFMKSGTIAIDAGNYLDLTIYPRNGFSLAKITKNGEDITNWFAPDNQFQFGPVGNSHLIVIKFDTLYPTGNVELGFPSSPLPGVAAIYDVTGHYSGVIPNSSTQRTFDADVAMDETGKLDIRVNSISNATFNPDELKIDGSVKTIGNRPSVTASIQGSGERGGEAISGKVTATGPIELTDVGNGVQGAQGNMSYKGKLAGIPQAANNVPMALPASPDLTRDWFLNISIVQKPDAKGTKRLYASADLTLPNNEHVLFAEKIVKYSSTKGYNLAFLKGTNQTTSLIDRRTRLNVTNMHFNYDGLSTWTLDGGKLKYAFLGQKGRGDLMDFRLP